MLPLEQLREDCQRKINENKMKIRKYEELYDSLKQFEGVIRDAGDEFAIANQERRKAVNGMGGNHKNCKSMTRYREGMQKELNEVGEWCVQRCFDVYGISIRAKLLEYKLKADELELENQTLGLAALDYTRQINELLTRSAT